MKVGDRVFVLCGLDVDEWEVYNVDEKGPWIRRSKGFGVRTSASGYMPYLSLDDAVAASRAAREREIKRCARRLESLAINTNVKVRLLKSKPPKGVVKEKT
jgi:hypothetical protein